METNYTDLLKTLYDSDYNEAFMLGVLKVIPKERRVFFDHHFVEITGFSTLKPDKWMPLDKSGLIEFLKEDPKLYEKIRSIFNGESDTDMDSVEIKTKDGKHVQVKVLVNSRHVDNVPEEVIAVFIDASNVERAVKEFNKLSAIFEASQEISRASTWWADYSESIEYFYQSDNGAIAAGIEPTPDKKYSIVEFEIMRENAAKMSEEFNAAVEAEKLSFRKAYDGETDTFGGRTPLLTQQGEIVWTDSRGKVVLRNEDGTPKFVVAVDIFINDIVEKEQELFKFQSLIDQGLDNSNIGVWWHEYKDGSYYFNQTSSYRSVMGIDNLLDVDENSMVWADYIKKFKKQYPMYIEYLEKDSNLFDQCLNGEIDSYENILPVLTSQNTIKWIEVRATAINRDETGKSLLMVGVNVDVTDRMKSEQLISELQRKNFVLNNANRKTIETTGLLVWSNDRIQVKDVKSYYANEAYMQTLGLTPDENGLASLEEYRTSFYPDAEGDDGKSILRSKGQLLMAGKINSYEGILVKYMNVQTKEPLFLEHYTYAQEVDDEGIPTVVGGYIRDLTEQILIEKENKELYIANERLRKADSLAIKSGQVMVWYQDNDEFDGSMKFFGNNIYVDKLGLQIDEDGLISLSDFRKSYYRLSEEGYMLAKQLREKDMALAANELDSYEKVRAIHKHRVTGELIYLEHYCEVEERYSDGYIKSMGGFMIDVTDTVNSQRRIEFLANRDTLTSLYNRNYFEDYVHNKLPESYSLLIFDLDGLKLINDTFGHLEGDKVIQYSAKLLMESYEDDSMIARIGGDEFAVVSKVLSEDIIVSRFEDIKAKIKTSNSESHFDIAMSYGHRIVINNEELFENAFSHAENLMYRRKLTDRRSRKSVTLDSLIETLNAKTEETAEHGIRLADTAVRTLRELGYSRVSEVEDMTLLARVHDIGKITVPESLLFKPSNLTFDEYEIVKQHSETGYKIIKNIVDSDKIADGVLHHHERVDGRGYPMGLKGDEIPLYAMVISVCDAYDAMTNGKPYALPISKEEAIQELVDCSGSQFDTKVVNAFIKAINKNDT